MKRVPIFLLPVIFLTITSCDLFNQSAFLQPLSGTWNWERTYGGFIGETIDADSVDYTQKLIINDEGEAFLYRNDELRVAYAIKFEKPEWHEQKTWIFYPKKDSSIQSYVSTLQNGKLVLMNACTDCYTLYFSKK
ncbi:MAG TPA: hypothetical protein VF181_09140 [Balneolaceae bacterium]